MIINTKLSINNSINNFKTQKSTSLVSYKGKKEQERFKYFQDKYDPYAGKNAIQLIKFTEKVFNKPYKEFPQWFKSFLYSPDRGSNSGLFAYSVFSESPALETLMATAGICLAVTAFGSMEIAKRFLKK